jgi:hypothetical protein
MSIIEFQNGQLWTYHSRPGEEGSRLVIIGTSLNAKYEKLFHIRVDGVSLYEKKELPHLALTPDALKSSVVEQTGTIEVAQESLELFEKWKTLSDGFFFVVPLAKCLEIIERSRQGSQDAMSADQTPENWLFGFPLREERPLTKEEFDLVFVRKKTHRKKALLFLGLSLAIFFVPLLVSFLLNNEGTLSKACLAVAIWLGPFVVWTIPRAISEFYKWQKLGPAGEQLVLRKFEGIVRTRAISKKRSVRALYRYFDLKSFEPQSITILSPSGIILKINSTPINEFIRVNSGRVSKAGFAQMSVSVAKYSSALGVGELMELRRRHLTLEEHRELKRHYQKICLRAIKLALLRFLVGAAAMLGALVTLDSATSFSYQIVREYSIWLCVLAGLGFTGHFAVMELRFALCLYRSEKIGYLGIYDFENSPNNAPIAEVLAVKRISWTRHGKPAPWRVFLS